jgi:hypothetical protein
MKIVIEWTQEEYDLYLVYKKSFNELKKIRERAIENYKENKLDNSCPLREDGYCHNCPIEKISPGFDCCLADNYMELPK